MRSFSFSLCPGFSAMFTYSIKEKGKTRDEQEIKSMLPWRRPSMLCITTVWKFKNFIRLIFSVRLIWANLESQKWQGTESWFAQPSPRKIAQIHVKLSKRKNATFPHCGHDTALESRQAGGDYWVDSSKGFTDKSIFVEWIKWRPFSPIFGQLR